MSLPVVLLHGFPLDPAMFQAQSSFLTAKGYQVHTPEFPGFGHRDPWPIDQCSIERFAEDLSQFLATLPSRRAIVGGFSMGGYVLAALLRDFPQYIAAAMFLNTRIEADLPEAKAARLKAIQDIPSQGLEPLAETMLTRLLSKNAKPALRQGIKDIMLRQNPEGVRGALYAMSRRRDQTDLLASIKIPVLIITGAEDVTTPPSLAINMHNHMPHSMLVQIAHAGHLAPLEEPASYNAALETFLKTVHAK